MFEELAGVDKIPTLLLKMLELTCTYKECINTDNIGHQHERVTKHIPTMALNNHALDK